jgi:enoyl-CoA hydratase/carnithine racemase
MISLRREEDVYVVDLGDGENRFNPEWVSAVDAALDEVEAAGAPRAAVLVGTGKIWSNGLDLEWMGAHPDQINDLLGQVHGLYARILGLGVPVVAAIQGHCFAAGAMLALACDSRIMRQDRGYFCLPEADINIPFTAGMNALIQARLEHQTAHEAMITARRYGGEDALAAGIVQAAVHDDLVLPLAIERAQEQAAKDPATLAAIKQRAYAETIAALLTTEGNTFG